MWIEINLTPPVEVGHASSTYQLIINSKHIVLIEPISRNDSKALRIETLSDCFNIYTYDDNVTDAIYNGFLIALQGSPVAFEEWGSIKPLLNHQVEAIHRRMLYQETLASLSNCEGIK